MLLQKLLAPLLSKLRSINPIHILVWTCGIIGLFSLTLSDFSSLLQDYTFNNVATVTEVIKNEAPPRPNLSVCLPYPSGALGTVVKWLNGSHLSTDSCPECEALKNHSWDVWTQMTDSRLDVNSLSVALVNKLLQMPDLEPWLTLDKRNFNWNQPIVDAVWRVFSCLANHDIEQTTTWQSPVLSPVCTTFDVSIFSKLSKNSTTDRLFDLVVAAIETYLTITVSRGEKTEIDTLSQRKHALIMKGYYFCIPMRANSEQETFVFSPFSYDPTSAPWQRTALFDTFFVADETILYSSTRSQELVYPKNQLHQVIPTNVHYEQVTLSYALNTRVIDTRPNSGCRKTSSPVRVCVSRRQMRRAVQDCGCMPFTHRNLIGSRSEFGGRPYCNATAYTACLGKLRENLDSNIQECKNKCKDEFYSWESLKREVVEKPSDMHFRINLAALENPFIEFRVTTKDSPEKFLAQVGGIVNLHLGFSGLSVCALVIWCIDFVVGRLWPGHRPRGAMKCSITREELQEAIRRVKMDLVIVAESAAVKKVTEITGGGRRSGETVL